MRVVVWWADREQAVAGWRGVSCSMGAVCMGEMHTWKGEGGGAKYVVL